MVLHIATAVRAHWTPSTEQLRLPAQMYVGFQAVENGPGLAVIAVKIVCIRRHIYSFVKANTSLDKCPDPGCQLSRKRIVNERGLWLHEFCHERKCIQYVPWLLLIFRADGCQTAFCRAKICLGKKYCVNRKFKLPSQMVIKTNLRLDGCIINGCPDQLLGGVFGGLCQTRKDLSPKLQIGCW